jgi:hypothetical protein
MEKASGGLQPLILIRILHRTRLPDPRPFPRFYRQQQPKTEHVGTKTAVQIRSHAQKFFSKLERQRDTSPGAGGNPDTGALRPPAR